VAYIGYNDGVRVAPGRTQPSRGKFAWGRATAATASLLAWIGVIVAVRAIF